MWEKVRNRSSSEAEGHARSAVKGRDVRDTAVRISARTGAKIAADLTALEEAVGIGTRNVRITL
jgi:hypothetical protein